jgi:hypothetical protein
MFKSCLVGMSCFLASSGSAFATQPGDGKDLERITVDFAAMQVLTSGMYKPDQDRKKSMSGLEAETAARREGILSFKAYIDNSCSGIENISAKNGWQQTFRSQGSTLFPEGTLEISLKAPYREVFQLSASAQKIPTLENGSKIVFILPSSLPGSAVRCGAIALELGGGRSAYIAPKTFIAGEQGGEKDSKNKYVKLVFDDKRDVLRPEKPEEVAGLALESVPAVTGVLYTTQKSE